MAWASTEKAASPRRPNALSAKRRWLEDRPRTSWILATGALLGVFMPQAHKGFQPPMWNISTLDRLGVPSARSSE